jgi:hypothetical protein
VEELTYIDLTMGYRAIVDPEDFEWLSQWSWHAHYKPKCGKAYAKRKIAGKKNLLMHRALAERWGWDISGKLIDHKNGDRVDNRKCNLRVASASENSANIQNVSGIYFETARNRWRGEVRFKSERHVFSDCISQDHAQAVAFALQRVLFDDFCSPHASKNFPLRSEAFNYLWSFRQLDNRSPRSKLDRLLIQVRLEFDSLPK